MNLSRRGFLVAALSLPVAASAWGRLAAAAAPPASEQVPGVYRTKIGQFEITALLDGYIDIELKYLILPTTESEELLKRAFLPVGPVRTAVNTFLINTGEHLVLIDTGSGNQLGPTMGRLPDNLKAAGIDPSKMDWVVLTHLHPDHVNGLITPQGGMAFPNAQVMIPQAEADFWLAAAVVEKMPELGRQFAGMAQRATAPYAAANKLKRFTPDTEIASGITALNAAGHTPGHTAFMIASNQERLLVWGDVVHVAALQFPRPEAAIEFDVDKPTAITTRRKFFAMAARERLLVAGMHLPFPGLGYVTEEQTGYAYHPAPWRLTL